MFNTYIEDKAMIPVLLGYDWMVSHGTWMLAKSTVSCTIWCAVLLV